MKSGGEWRKFDKSGRLVVKDGAEQSKDTDELMAEAFPASDSQGRALLAYVEFWVELRNCVAHRHIPGLDLPVIPQAQASLINLERVLTTEFGEEYALAEYLTA